MKRMPLAGAFLSIVAALLVLSNIFFDNSKAQSETVKRAEVSKKQAPAQDLPLKTKFDNLIAKAQDSGTVRVIIGLRTNYSPEGYLANDSKREAQRDAIAEVQNDVTEKLKGYRVESVKQFEFIPFMAMEVDSAALGQIKQFAEVGSLEEDVLADPTMQQSIPLIGAPNAWSSGYTGAGRTVAVLDTGVDKNHAFFGGRVVSEACYSSNVTATATSLCPGGVTESTASNSGLNCDTSVSGCFHGTHVAGTVAGNNSASNIFGVAKDANIIAIQVFSLFTPTACNSATQCIRTYNSDQIKGLERVYALRNTYTIDAVNMSLGGGQYFANCDAANLARKAAIDNLRSANIATIIASGNDGFTNSMGAPACISTAISVGSTQDGSSGTADTVSSFSNGASFLNILAPGQTITSSVPGGGYGGANGTSMATPHVAGAWAVVRSKYPNDTVQQTLDRLVSTGLPVTDIRNGITKNRIRLDHAVGNPASDSCAAPSPIVIGQIINGTLDGGDCLVSGKRRDRYSFSGIAGQQITVNLDSAAFDTYLYLLNSSSGQAISENNNTSGAITNSRIPLTGTFTLPTTGSYIISASSYDFGITGAYTISLTSPFYNISGAVTYGTTPTGQTPKVVSNVSFAVTGAPSVSATTNVLGIYSLENLTANGEYTVTPTKSGNVNGISPVDATLILKHIAANGQGPNVLNPNQILAADASGDGNISPFDATLILRYIAAGTSNANTGEVGNWKFDPVSRPYQPLNNSVSGENYTAILIGEVNGNWTP
ncbi:MAG TPA: S8 family serine peptidase [Pyrinomonadaceae bacterium]